ncbi:hypothetical protein GCM10009849_01580 [Sinomonas flava]|uniref:Uncharacterized protein n=1 Tax=Sinomonas flava TaxID=496857 RepID=A0ABP5NEA1_9MICC
MLGPGNHREECLVDRHDPQRIRGNRAEHGVDGPAGSGVFSDALSGGCGLCHSSRLAFALHDVKKFAEAFVRIGDDADVTFLFLTVCKD